MGAFSRASMKWCLFESIRVIPRTAITAIKVDSDGGYPLPDEIVEDILSRLPVKSLRRFRCVSRTWNGVITSAEFEGLHFERFSGGGGADRGNRTVFLNPNGPCHPFYAWKQADGPVETILRTGLPEGNVFPITKSCHGLVLLCCITYKMHYVWNPSAREILPLPDRIPPGLAWRTFNTFYMAYGMGYCSASEQYKVVRMYNPGGLDDDTAVCEVSVLGESTPWRPAATQPPACQLRVRGTQGAVLCNGNLHFVQKETYGAGLDLLATFNVSSETFGTLELLLKLESSSSEFMLTELDGCLCVYHTEHNPKLEDPYHIWLLRDYEAGRWENLRCIDWGSVAKTESALLKSSWIAPLDMYYDDQKKKKIMFGTGTCKLFVVDPDIGIPEIVFSPVGTTIGECGDGQFPTMGLFEESLVSVGPTSEEIIFSSPSAECWSEVLTYLPARTVGRLNQVCRGWRAMIKAECFARVHLYRANLKKSPQIMLTNGKPYGFRRLEDLIGTDDTPPLVDGDDVDGSRVVCSKPCHGLNAGSFGKYDFVCNPLTKYYKLMDNDKGEEWRSPNSFSFLYRDFHTPSPSPSGAEDAVLLPGRLGLGFEHNVGMHVLVRLVYKKRDMATRDYELECKMRFVDQRFWRRVEPPPPRPVADVPPVYANGKLYWMVDPELGPRPPAGCCEIFALDLSTREFQVLEGPPVGSGCTTIVELGGEVCVAPSKQSTNAIEIWAADATAGGAWSVRHSVELERFSHEYSSEEATPLAIGPEDGSILLSTGRALGYYDPKTAELETIYRLGRPHVQAGKKFVPILYMDSLVEPCDAMR